jgi:hypothetical protein
MGRRLGPSFARGPDDADYVETDRHLCDPVFLTIDAGQEGQFLLLPEIDRFVRFAMEVALTGFDLDKNQRLAVEGYKIYLTLTQPDSTGNDFHSRTSQKTSGKPFAPST